MKKLIIIGLALVSNLSLAQEHKYQVPVNPRFCGQVEAQEAIYDMHPDYRIQDSISQAQFQIDYESFLANDYSPDDRVAYTVPIVFHVVHLNGPENVSNAQIYDCIENLNKDYSATNYDFGNTVAAFQGVASNADIEFVLATKAPNGTCHSGITRTYSNTTYDTGLSGGTHPIVEAVIDEHGVWPQNKYLNIFICIDPSGAAGYTYNPASWLPSSSMYGGILLRHDYTGTIGTGSSSSRHTLAHEAGHWLNLSHNWGGSNTPGVASNCNIDDGVADTPNSEGWTYCNLNGNSCGSLDNVQNFMEYSYCSTMFTHGQAARMYSALNSSTAGRNNLSTPSNLIATGTDAPSNLLCGVNFSSSETIICAGSTIDFSDLSFHGVTSRNWIFTGGTPAISTDSNTTITYNTPGVYNVSLEISNGSSNLTETTQNYITVLANPGLDLPYSESFETVSVPDNINFFVTNEDNGNDWGVTNTASSSGSKSIKMSNFGVTGNSIDEFYSGTIDLSVLDPSENLIMTFKYAYNKLHANDDEYLKVYVSNDCGQNWSLRKSIHGNSLSENTYGSPYTPTSDSEWNMVSFENIHNTFYTSNFRYKFQFTSDNGNNIFVDDINLYPESWLDNPENNIENVISIFPNPTQNNSTINYFSSENDNIDITFLYVIGQNISTVYYGSVSTGLNQYVFIMEALPKGIYIVKITNSKGIKSVKLIKD